LGFPAGSDLGLMSATVGVISAVVFGMAMDALKQSSQKQIKISGVKKLKQMIKIRLNS